MYAYNYLSILRFLQLIYCLAVLRREFEVVLWYKIPQDITSYQDNAQPYKRVRRGSATNYST